MVAAACLEPRPLFDPRFATLLPRRPAARAGAFARRAAALLFLYVTLGWLAPTLLLVRPPRGGPEGSAANPLAAPQRHAQHGGGGGGALAAAAAAYHRLVAAAEAQLQLLLPAPPRSKRHAEERLGDEEPLPGTKRALRWWLLLVGTWAVCCAAAPAFEPRRA